MRFLYIVFLVSIATIGLTQNTLDNLGLPSSSPGVLAYSLRQLSTSYTGPSLEVRRSSDNAEGVVYFNAANTPASVNAGSNFTYTPGASLTGPLGVAKSGTISSTISKIGTITITVNKTGTITTSNSSTTVNGTGTNFTTQLSVGDLLFNTSNVFLGVIKSITNNTRLELNNTATLSESGIAYKSNKATVTGVGTLFSTELAVGDKLYNASNSYLGTITAITNNTNCVVDSYNAIASTAIAYKGTSSVITGVGTNFTTEISIGDVLISNNITLGIVASITNATSLTLQTKAGGAVTAQAFSATTGTIPFSSFYGSTDVFVKTWYDQSGYNRHTTQKNNAYQPQIISAGNFFIVNNKITIKFSSALNSFLQTSSAAQYLAGTDFTLSVVSSETNPLVPNPSYPVSTTGGLGPNNSILSFGYKNGGQYVMNMYGNEHIYNTTASSLLETHTTRKYNPIKSEFSKNGYVVADVSGGSPSSMSNLGLFQIGLYTPTNTYFNGNIFEIAAFIWADAVTATILNGNQSVYYNVSEAQWTGNTDSDWNNTTNWSPQVIPNESSPSNVIIPAGRPNYPIITSGQTASAVNIYIANGASVTVSAVGTLRVAGTISNFGTCTATDGTIEFIGQNLQTIANNTFAGNTIGNLSISNSNSSSVLLEGSVTVTNNITFNAAAGTGKLQLNGNTLTLGGTITNPGTNIIGSTTSSIVFNGSGNVSFGLDQTSPGTTNALQNVTINRNGNVVSLNSNTQLASTGILTFTAGKLAIANNSLEIAGGIINTATAGIQGSANAILTVSGTINKTMSIDQTTPGTSNSFAELTIATTNTNTTTLQGNISVSNVLTVNSGETLDATTYIIGGTITTVNANGIIYTQNTSSTPLPNNKTWGGTVIYNGSTAQTAVTGTYSNVTINNTAGANANGNITINGILNLSSNNASATKGALDMGATYELLMGGSATTIGNGEVTGRIKRTTLLANTIYSFGNQNTTLTFTGGTGAQLPSQIIVIVTIGATHPIKSNTVQRYYQIVRTGGSSPTRYNLSLHYLDSELNGIDEANLIYWDHHIPYAGITPHPHGKSAQNTSVNTMNLASHGIGYLVENEYFGELAYIDNTATPQNQAKIWMLAARTTPVGSNIFVWQGTDSEDPTDWAAANNWEDNVSPLTAITNGVPANTHIIYIKNAPFYPTLPSGTTTLNYLYLTENGTLNAGTGNSLQANYISIDAGSTFNAEDATITLNGPLNINNGDVSWNNTGAFNAGTSKVVFNNAESAQSGSTNFYDVEVANGSTLSLIEGSVLGIGNTISLTGTGKLNTTLLGNSTVLYNKAGNQTIVEPENATYSTLVLSGSGTKTIAASNPLTIQNNIEIKESAVASTSNALTILGNVSTEIGSTFTPNAHAHSIAGNITNNGTWNASANSEIILNGTTEQTISGNQALNFYTLDINNAAHISLTNNININQELQLTQGNLKVQSQTLGINGSISGSSKIDVSPLSSLSFGGTLAQTIPADVFLTSPSILDLSINNTFEVIPNNQNFTINGILNLQNGNLNLTNKEISINGSITKTAGSLDVNNGSRLNFGENLANLTLPNNLFIGSEIGTIFLERAGGITLGNQSPIITDKLIFSNGIITTGSSQVVFNPGALVGSALDAYGNTIEIDHLFPQYVTSYIHGCAKKIGIEPFTFPIGSATLYAPMSISEAKNTLDASTEFTGCYNHESPHSLYNTALITGDLHHVSTSEYWTLHRAGGANEVNVTLYWYLPRSNAVTLLDNLRVAHWDGSTWESKGNTSHTGDFESGSITSTLVNNFSPFTLGSTSSENPLPVTLINFAAKVKNNKTTISWETASETNNDYFLLEQSKDGINWTVIKKIKGAGTSSQINSYWHLEKTNNEPYYYQLSQVDNDGTKVTFPIIYSSSEEVIEDVYVYPNPAKKSISLSCTEEYLDKKYSIIDSKGNRTHSGIITKSTLKIGTDSLTEGIYFILIPELNRTIQFNKK